MIAKRLLYNELEKDIFSRDITILLGARQVGKTFLMAELEAKARESGKKTAYFNLEVPAHLLQFKGSDSHIYALLAHAGEVVFIDEFHYLENASHIFKALYDSTKIKIFASGSSSLEIHKHLKESLAGRRRLRKIYPLNLSEFKINQMPFDSYLIEGGLPGLLNYDSSADRQDYLQGLVETYIFKDIKSLIREENIKAFNHLLFLLAQSQGSIVSVLSLSGEIGLTARTVEKYLEILEQTYVCYSLVSYSSNQANELKKSKKYYFYDMGIRNTILKDFEPNLKQRKDKGVLLESAVFLQLMQKVSPNTAIHFWRTRQGEEVDFVKVVNRKPMPIEVKSNLLEPKIPDGIKIFLEKYPEVSEAYVVSQSLAAEVSYKNATVRFIPWYDADQI